MAASQSLEDATHRTRYSLPMALAALAQDIYALTASVVRPLVTGKLLHINQGLWLILDKWYIRRTLQKRMPA